jgi:hypothetical protein
MAHQAADAALAVLLMKADAASTLLARLTDDCCPCGELSLHFEAQKK